MSVIFSQLGTSLLCRIRRLSSVQSSPMERVRISVSTSWPNLRTKRSLIERARSPAIRLLVAIEPSGEDEAVMVIESTKNSYWLISVSISRSILASCTWFWPIVSITLARPTGKVM
mgnify:CR=1 FL=1